MSNEFDVDKREDTRTGDRVMVKKFTGLAYPTLVITVAMHGNEPASLAAMKWLFSPEKLGNARIQGNIYVLVGNIEALNRSQRFIHKDLNRIWTRENLELVRNKSTSEWPEIHELHELKDLDQRINSILTAHKSGPVLFLDLHTTSADSAPFLPFNDAIMNRRLAEKFPLPLILGIEEFLDGPLMSHINDLGFPALGFEAGRHDDPYSTDRHAAFVELFVYHLGMLHLSDEKVARLTNMLTQGFKFSPGFYEIIHKHTVVPFSGFKMKEGFRNFQYIEKSEELANDHSGIISAIRAGLIFMPLYQKEGDDGFFIVRPVSQIWLWISAQIRKINLLKHLHYLPGVRIDTLNPRIYWANPTITRFISRKLFHLLGFRVKIISSKLLMIVSRD